MIWLQAVVVNLNKTTSCSLSINNACLHFNRNCTSCREQILVFICAGRSLLISRLVLSRWQATAHYTAASWRVCCRNATRSVCGSFVNFYNLFGVIIHWCTKWASLVAQTCMNNINIDIVTQCLYLSVLPMEMIALSIIYWLIDSIP